MHLCNNIEINGSSYNYNGYKLQNITILAVLILEHVKLYIYVHVHIVFIHSNIVSSYINNSFYHLPRNIRLWRNSQMNQLMAMLNTMKPKIYVMRTITELEKRQYKHS